MPDDPTLLAAMHGPLVLAGRLGTEGLTPDILRAEPTKPRMVPEYKSDPVRPRPSAPPPRIPRSGCAPFPAGPSSTRPRGRTMPIVSLRSTR